MPAATGWKLKEKLNTQQAEGLPAGVWAAALESQPVSSLERSFVSLM